MKKLVKGNVYWIGKMDWELESFHGADYTINHGMAVKKVWKLDISVAVQ